MEEFFQTHLLQNLLVFSRIGAFFSVLPAIGGAALSSRIKVVLTVFVTLVSTPLIDTPAVGQVNAMGFLSMCLSEVVVGLAFGLLVRTFALGLQIAGSIAAQSTSLAQIFGNNISEPVPAMGHVLYIGGLCLLMINDFHVKAVYLVVQTYEVVPAASILSASDAALVYIGNLAAIFSLSFSIAAPFLILACLYNLALGVINRAMPQLMVAFVGAPAISLASLVLFALASGLMLSVWITQFDQLLENPLVFAR